MKGSLQYAVYTYKGSDVPSFTGTSGRPTGITFTGNTFDGAGAELFKIQDSDKFTFTGGSIKPGALTRGPKFERAAGHVFGPVTMPSGTTTFTLRGTSAVKTTLAIKGIPASAVKIDKDAYSSATFDGTTLSATPTATATPTLDGDARRHLRADSRIPDRDGRSDRGAARRRERAHQPDPRSDGGGGGPSRGRGDHSLDQ